MRESGGVWGPPHKLLPPPPWHTASATASSSKQQALGCSWLSQVEAPGSGQLQPGPRAAHGSKKQNQASLLLLNRAPHISCAAPGTHTPPEGSPMRWSQLLSLLPHAAPGTPPEVAGSPAACFLAEPWELHVVAGSREGIQFHRAGLPLVAHKSLEVQVRCGDPM